MKGRKSILLAASLMLIPCTAGAQAESISAQMMSLAMNFMTVFSRSRMKVGCG